MHILSVRRCRPTPLPPHPVIPFQQHGWLRWPECRISCLICGNPRKSRMWATVQSHGNPRKSQKWTGRLHGCWCCPLLLVYFSVGVTAATAVVLCPPFMVFACLLPANPQLQHRRSERVWQGELYAPTKGGPYGCLCRNSSPKISSNPRSLDRPFAGGCGYFWDPMTSVAMGCLLSLAGLVARTRAEMFQACGHAQQRRCGGTFLEISVGRCSCFVLSLTPFTNRPLILSVFCS